MKNRIAAYLSYTPEYIYNGLKNTRWKTRMVRRIDRGSKSTKGSICAKLVISFIWPIHVTGHLLWSKPCATIGSGDWTGVCLNLFWWGRQVQRNTVGSKLHSDEIHVTEGCGSSVVGATRVTLDGEDWEGFSGGHVSRALKNLNFHPTQVPHKKHTLCINSKM